VETRLLFLIILLLCLWLIFSKKGRLLVDKLKENILNQVFGKQINGEVPADAE
jgi:hypothetical protein